MLFSLMLLCAIAAILVVAMGTFTELREIWFHPDRRQEDNASRLVGTRPK